jgi:hypothetical protein
MLTLQWKLHNVITLGQRETENIDRMITITGNFYRDPFLCSNLLQCFTNGTYDIRSQ